MNCYLWYRRVHVVTMKEMFDTKLKNWFFKRILCIPIDRENTDVRTFKHIVNVLKDKRVVGIFPEGHINNSEKDVDFFKSGTTLMALKGGAPIDPMVIIKRKKWYSRQIVVIGEKIQIEQGNFNLHEIDKISKTLREKEEELINLYKKRSTK